jgi:hypothetical protein
LLIPAQTKVPAMPLGNWLRKDALRESHNRQEQNEALTKAVLDFTEGIGIIKTYNLLGENPAGQPAHIHGVARGGGCWTLPLHQWKL